MSSVDPVLLCPGCGERARIRRGEHFHCRHCDFRSSVRLLPDPTDHAGPISPEELEISAFSLRQSFFEDFYGEEAEPWSYTTRAAEMLRHDFLVREAARLLPPRGRVADLGCSLGQLTCRLGPVAEEVHGLDLSARAIATARQGAAAANSDASFFFSVGSVTDLPFRDGSLDLLLLCDGLFSWRLNSAEQQQVLREASRAAAPGAHLLLTDYLPTDRFQPFLEAVERSPLDVVEVRMMHDRLWYSLERALRNRLESRLVRRVLASRTIGRVLARLSRLAGRRGSKHIYIVARKPASPASSG
jgi:SAM-dependent methyltransferase